MPGAGRPAPMTSAAHRENSAASFVAICAYAYAVRTGRSPHGVPSCWTSGFAISADAGEPGSQIQAGCAVHRSTRSATSLTKVFSSSLNSTYIFSPSPVVPAPLARCLGVARSGTRHTIEPCVEAKTPPATLADGRSRIPDVAAPP